MMRMRIPPLQVNGLLQSRSGKDDEGTGRPQ